MSAAVRALGRAAGSGEPLSLSALRERAELMARFDRTYVVPYPVFAAVASRLTGFRPLAIGGRRVFTYRSVYFDTPALRAFHDHRQGRRRRFKVRERLYADTGERWFEVKLKGRRGETLKHRRRLSLHEPPLGPGPLAFLAEVLASSYGMPPPALLTPAVATDYMRSTFVAAGERVTCDAALVCRDLRTGATVSSSGDLLLVETKSSSLLSRADRVLHAHGARPADFTKYCAALAGLRPALPANRWRRASRRVFGAPAASRGRLPG